MRPTASLILLATAAITQPTLASVPTHWIFRVVAREGPVGTAFGVPAGCELVQNDPGLDNAGSACVRFTMGGNEGIFVYNAATSSGSVVVNAPGGTYSTSIDVLSTRLALTQNAGPVEVRDYSGSLLYSFPLGGSEGTTGSITRVRLAGTGAIGYRATAGSISKTIVDRYVGPARVQVALASTDAASAYVFLYSPTINDSLQMASKADLRGGGSAIVRWQEGQAPVTIQVTAGSPYNLISNGTDLNNGGEVAFFVRLTSDATFRLMKGDGASITPIASGAPGNPQGILNSAFANFPPVINAAGLVAFRPNDTSGNAIYVGDGVDLVRIVGDGSVVQLPGGLTSSLGSGGGSPRTSIIGNIALSDADPPQLALVGRLSDGTDALIIGTAITCSADFNGDGDIGTDADIEAFFACLAGTCCATCGSADFNLDGDVGTDADIESFFRVLAGGPC